MGEEKNEGTREKEREYWVKQELHPLTGVTLNTEGTERELVTFMLFLFMDIHYVDFQTSWISAIKLAVITMIFHTFMHPSFVDFQMRSIFCKIITFVTWKSCYVVHIKYMDLQKLLNVCVKCTALVNFTMKI